METATKSVYSDAPMSGDLNHSSERDLLSKDTKAKGLSFGFQRPDPKLFSLYRAKLKFNDKMCAIATLLSLGISILEYEIYFDNNLESSTSTNVLRTIIIILTLFIMIFVAKHYALDFEYLKT